MAERLLKRGGNAFWGVADQFLSALSNAGMTFAGANLLGVKEFGIYALLFTAVTIILGLARAVTSEVYTVLMTTGDRETRRLRQGQALGASGAIGTLALLLGGAVALFGVPAAAVFGLACVPVLVQDTIRFLLVAERRVRAAFVNDCVWVLVQFSLLLWLVLLGHASLTVLALTWGLGALGAAAVGVWQLRVAPSITGVLPWFRDTRGYSGYYVLEFAALAGSGYSIVYLVAIFGGIGGAGAYRGAQAVFGPVTSLIGGLRMVALPAIVRLRSQGRGPVVRASQLFAGAVFTVSVLITLGIWGLRDWVVPLLLGATGAAAMGIIIPMGLGRAFSSASSGPLLGLRALGATRRSLMARVSLSLLTLVAAGVGSWLDGGAGAAWGFAGASAVGMLVWTSMLRRQEMLIPAEKGV